MTRQDRMKEGKEGWREGRWQTDREAGRHADRLYDNRKRFLI